MREIDLGICVCMWYLLTLGILSALGAVNWSVLAYAYRTSHGTYSAFQKINCEFKDCVKNPAIQNHENLSKSWLCGLRYEALSAFPSSLPWCAQHWTCFLCHFDLSFQPWKSLLLACSRLPVQWLFCKRNPLRLLVANLAFFSFLLPVRRTGNEDTEQTSFLGYHGLSQCYNKDLTDAYWSPKAGHNFNFEAQASVIKICPIICYEVKVRGLRL